MNKRVIPCLLIKDRGLVKTVKFRNPVYVGDPINAVKIFNDKEVDELIVVDMYAVKDGRAPDVEFIRDMVSEAFMPIAYAGGISSMHQIEEVLRIGVEKISVNYHSHESLDFISEATREFGSSTIIGGIDIKKDFLGRQRVYRLNGKLNTRKTPIEHARSLVEAGAGELFVNSIDRDGRYLGYDIESLRQISDSVNVPVIACGGAGSLDDIKELLTQTNVAAAAAGSIFVFHGLHRAVLISYPPPLELKKITKHS